MPEGSEGRSLQCWNRSGEYNPIETDEYNLMDASADCFALDFVNAGYNLLGETDVDIAYKSSQFSPPDVLLSISKNYLTLHGECEDVDGIIEEDMHEDSQRLIIDFLAVIKHRTCET